MTDAMKEKVRRILPKIGYPIFYLFALLVSFSWAFPYDKLRDRIVTTFNAAQRASSSPQELQIEELGSSWLTGVKAHGVKLIAPPSDPSKGPTELKIDEVRARISLLSLLVGNKHVNFAIDAFEGAIRGSFEDSGKERSIDLTFEDIDMSKVDAIAANIGFPLDGKLGGTLKLQLPEGKASKGNGSVNLEVREMYAGNAKGLTIKAGFAPVTLPRLKVGTLSVTGEAKDGVLKLTKFGATGGDVDVSGDGRVQLREVATDAQIDVSFKFKVNDAYRKKNDSTKSLFGDPDRKDKPLLDMEPRMAKSKGADGFYSMRIGRTLGRPDVQPAGGGIPVPGLGSGGFKP